MNARAFFTRVAAAFTWLAVALSPGARAQQVELNPGYISGTVDVAGFTVSSRQIYASGPNGAQASASLNGGGSYTLTVNVPSGSSASFSVYAYAYTNNTSNYMRYPSQTVSVSQGATATADFTASPAIVNAAVTVSGGTLNYAYIYAARNDGASAQGYAGSSGAVQFPAFAGASITLYGTAYLTNGTQVSLPSQSINLSQGVATNVTWNVAAPSASGGIAGTFAMQGATPHYVSMYASGPVFQSLSLSGNGPYSFSNLPAGNYYLYAYAYFDNYMSYLALPSSAFDPTRNPAIGNSVATINIGTSIANIAGQVTLTGSKSIAQANYAETGIQAFGQGPSSGGFGYSRLNLPGGTFLARASAGDWWSSYLYVSFYNSSPGSFINASFQLNDYTQQSQPVTALPGQTVTRNLSYAVGTVALTLRTNGTPFSSPYLSALCYKRNANNQTLWQFWAYSYGNQQNVSEAQLTLVGPEGNCSVNAYGYINGGSTQFGQVNVNIVPGSNQVIDLGGPSLTVQAPSTDYVTSNSTITVSGTATDDVSVASVSVNGNAATLSPAAGLPSISFSASIGLAPGANEIMTIATDGSGKQGTDTRTVYRDAGPPTLVVTSPADGTVTLDSTVTITGTVTDDVEVKSITLNGNAVSFTTGGNPADPREVAFTVIAGLQDGDNFLTITAKDETPTQSASQTLKVTKSTVQSQTITFAALPDKTYGDAAITLGATASSGLAVSYSASGQCTVSGATLTLTGAGNCSVTASQAGNAQYSAAPDVTRGFAIGKATPALSWANPADIVYGTAIGATQLNATAAGVGGGSLAGTFIYTPLSGTVLNAGPSQNLSVSFTPNDTTNYSSPVAKSVTINVTKASQGVVTVSAPLSATYAQGGVAAAASGGSGTGAYSYSAAGSSACTVDSSSGAITITSGTGTCSITATRAGDGNYLPSAPSNAASITIGKATTLTTVTVSDATYDGNAHGGSAGVTGVAGLNQPLTVTYAGTGSTTYGPSTTPPTNAGTYSASASFPTTTNYLASGDTTGFTIFKAASQVVVTGGTFDYDGNPHAAAGAVVSGAGTGITQAVTWTYTPPGSATLPVNAGNYTATATYAGDANHLGSNGAASVVINAVPATIVYTGLETWSTSSATSTTATVTSSATVTASAGNVASARVTFTNEQNPSGIPGCVNLAVGAASGLTGSVACQWTATVPSSGSNAGFLNTTVTAVLLPGNYLATSDSDAINVTQPNQQNFITGGGYLTLSASAGQYAGDARSKSNFGFNVKYNKSGTNLQGNINILVRKGTKVYQFKSNAMNSLTTKAADASFTGKANLQSWDVADPALVTSLAGNLTIQLQATDVADPGAGKDKLAISVWDSGGALLYSSNWNGTTTAPQAISGGNLQVR